MSRVPSLARYGKAFPFLRKDTNSASSSGDPVFVKTERVSVSGCGVLAAGLQVDSNASRSARCLESSNRVESYPDAQARFIPTGHIHSTIDLPPCSSPIPIRAKQPGVSRYEPDNRDELGTSGFQAILTDRPNSKRAIQPGLFIIANSIFLYNKGARFARGNRQNMKYLRKYAQFPPDRHFFTRFCSRTIRY